MSEIQEFLKALQKDPSLISKLKKRDELEEFKEKYNVERATPLKCPACASILQSPGSLYIDKDDHTLFTCKKCKLQYKIECLTLPNDDLIGNLRLVVKGDKNAKLEWYKKFEGKEDG